MLEALAEKYALTLGTSILASHEHDGVITFVLESGSKLTMSEAELTTALDQSQGLQPATPADDTGEQAPQTKRKPRSK